MGKPKERSMFSVMMENLKDSHVTVRVLCENAGLDDPPDGVELVYVSNNDTFCLPSTTPGYTIGEAWCQQSVVAYSGDVGSFSEARAASDIERKGWSLRGGKLLCQHCTKRKTNGGVK